MYSIQLLEKAEAREKDQLKAEERKVSGLHGINVVLHILVG